MPTTQYNLAVANGPDGRVYAIGGFGYSVGGLNTVEAYTPGTNSWATVAPMATARNAPAAATGLDGRIYAIGGYNGGDLNTVEAYTPGTNSWATVASMPTARSNLAAATAPDGRIYAIGGGTNGSLNTVEAYTPATDTWATMAPMPTARNGLAAATGPDGRIYAVGGEHNRVELNTVEVYTPATDSWATVASMPTARDYLGAATGPDGHVYAIGGGYNEYLNTVEAYTPGTNSWATVASMATGREALAAATGSDGRIYAMGGLDGGVFLSSVEAYDTGALDLVTFEDTSPHVGYNSWQGFSDPTASGGTYRASSTKAAKVTLKFSGTGITWITRKGPDQGIASVTIDGTTKGNVDLYSASAQSDPQSYSSLATKTHTIVISVTGTKDTASSGKQVAVDAFVVGFTTTEDSSTKVTYDTWKGVNSTSANGGTYRVSPKKGATTRLSFTGTGVDWVTTTSPSAGMASVSIDGVSKGTVDLYASSVNWQVVEGYGGLPSGTHTIVVTVLGAKNAASAGTLIVVDAFVVAH